MPSVDWHAYAEKYDLLLSYNPYYQEVHALVLENIRSWDISDQWCHCRPWRRYGQLLGINSPNVSPGASAAHR